jgi:uncharacterized protein YciI
MNQYLYKIQLNRIEILTEGPTDEEAKALSGHAEFVNDLADKGVVLLAGRTQTIESNGFGIVIFVAESEEAAQAIMAQDPAIKNTVMNAELFPYRIAFTSLTGIPEPA